MSFRALIFSWLRSWTWNKLTGGIAETSVGNTTVKPFILLNSYIMRNEWGNKEGEGHGGMVRHTVTVRSDCKHNRGNPERVSVSHSWQTLNRPCQKGGRALTLLVEVVTSLVIASPLSEKIRVNFCSQMRPTISSEGASGHLFGAEGSRVKLFTHNHIDPPWGNLIWSRMQQSHLP